MIQWNKGEPPKDGGEYLVLVKDEDNFELIKDEDGFADPYPLICYRALGEWHIKPDCGPLSETESILAWSEINQPEDQP